METLAFFYYRLRIVMLFFILSFSNTFGQTSSGVDTPIVILTSTLNDGTRIWGMLREERDAEFVVFDFNLGEVRVPKHIVNTVERETLETAVIVETTNDATYFGSIIGVTSKTLIMKSALIDTFEIQSNTISKITLPGAYVDRKGRNWFANPNATRYFFAPSAIPLKKKEGYYQNAYLIANSVNVGITNSVTLGGGVVIPLLFYVTPKISCKVYKNVYLGAGILFTQSFITEFKLSAGIGYGLVTLGNREHNLTLAAGFGYSRVDSNYGSTRRPIATLNGMSRIGKRLSLVTENWLIPRARYNEEYTAYDPYGAPYTEMVPVKKDFYTLALSLGLRIMPGVKTSIDFSVVGLKANPYGSYLFLPYLDFVYKFN